MKNLEFILRDIFKKKIIKEGKVHLKKEMLLNILTLDINNINLNK